jgi:RNA recognition motif-containing protein
VNELLSVKGGLMRLFVGNLPYLVNDVRLRQLFAIHGAVESASVIYDREMGRSKGFGFVTMTNDEEAKQAVTMLHESDYEGRKLIVSEAHPKVPKQPTQSVSVALVDSKPLN